MSSDREEMWVPKLPLTMKESTALFPNNLSASSVGGGAMNYVVASRGVVNVVVGLLPVAWCYLIY